MLHAIPVDQFQKKEEKKKDEEEEEKKKKKVEKKEEKKEEKKVEKKVEEKKEEKKEEEKKVAAELSGLIETSFRAVAFYSTLVAFAPCQPSLVINKTFLRSPQKIVTLHKTGKIDCLAKKLL